MRDFAERQRRAPTIAVLCLAVAAFAIFGVGRAQAATVVCGQVITQDTKVSNDLLNCPGDGLVIGADNVKLDLRGHLIDGDELFSGTDAGIDNSGGFDNVQITRGTIQQFSQGVALVGATNNELTRLDVLENILGILLFEGSDDNLVRNNDVHDNRRVGGILLEDTTGNTVTHNEVFGNGSTGIGSVSIAAFTSTLVEISHNLVHDNARTGIWLNNSDDSVVTANTTELNGFDGIELGLGSTGNLVVGNEASLNGWDGIDVGDAGNTLTSNNADGNFNLGILAAPGTVDGGGNSATGNGNPAQCVGVSCS
jgi:parallel beta-helix repeat protein